MNKQLLELLSQAHGVLNEIWDIEPEYAEENIGGNVFKLIENTLNSLEKEECEKERLRDDRQIYSLNVEDLQHVASQEIGRSLTANEIEDVEDSFSLEWYEEVKYLINDLK